MFLLVPAHPGFPGQIPQSRKTVVCVCVLLFTGNTQHYRGLVAEGHITSRCPISDVPLFIIYKAVNLRSQPFAQ